MLPSTYTTNVIHTHYSDYNTKTFQNRPKCPGISPYLFVAAARVSNWRASVVHETLFLAGLQRIVRRRYLNQTPNWFRWSSQSSVWPLRYQYEALGKTETPTLSDKWYYWLILISQFCKAETGECWDWCRCSVAREDVCVSVGRISSIKTESSLFSLEKTNAASSAWMFVETLFGYKACKTS